MGFGRVKRNIGLEHVDDAAFFAMSGHQVELDCLLCQAWHSVTQQQVLLAW